ncbi:uncharacterized protein LOC128858166 isoform X1 [Anastrepha ludens]|uniref:uncharacterized protein LOC128858166 isoform X1 n=1 Tax=Anastrepha ludens TaxID=28586 RepID=UPI0023B0A213|nr:uncharacterized protein LOC128858166 isoform X1 [Anastrepha ludens]
MMAEIDDLKRLEDQLYVYYPRLKQDSEGLKLERRKQLSLQLRSSCPVVQLPTFDAVSSLTNIKYLLEKCQDCMIDQRGNYSEMGEESLPMSLLELSGDELSGTQKFRHPSRKRKSSFALIHPSEIEESRNGFKEQDSPLSLSILIPQVVKGSDKMEISIDLGGIDASQRLFSSRVDGLLRNRSNSTNMIEEKPSSCNKNKNLQLSVEASNNIETVPENNEKQEDEVLSRLISQVLVDNQQSETLQATSVLDNINANESTNYDAYVPVPIETSKEETKKKKRQRKPKKTIVEKGPSKKRGRKPKKISSKKGTVENAGMPKSDLAKYVELFSDTCNMAGSATPAASSTISQQLVTSTTHYLDSNEQQPITYYLEGDWENGGSCQLIQTESAQIDSGQEEFNMAELVNYIDNVGDTANVIARVLDGPATHPITVQDSQSQNNTVVPPPAHISDVLLDLSKKSTIAADVTNKAVVVADQDLLPLDLSLKSSRLNECSIAINNGLMPLKSVVALGKLGTATEEVFNNNDYDSFGAALDMPLIDIEGNIDAFMQLTDSPVITSATEKTAPSVVCTSSIGANTSNTLPDPDFELNEVLLNINKRVNSTKHGQSGNDSITEISQIDKSAEHQHSDSVNVREDSFTSIHPNASSTQEVPVRESYNNTVLENTIKETNISHNESSKSEDIGACGTCKDKIENHISSQCVDHVDGDSSDKSSLDVLFVDTESLLANKTKISYDESAIISELDTPGEHLTRTKQDRTANVADEPQNFQDNDEISCDLSTEYDHSKSIDLVEDNQEHHVSVHLPMPQLTLMENNSEDFNSDYEFGLENSEEREAISEQAEKQQHDESQQEISDGGDASKLYKNEGTGKVCSDSGIECSLFSTESITKTPLMLTDVSGATDIERIDKNKKEENTFEEKHVTENEHKETSTFEDSTVCCEQVYGNANNKLETGTEELKQRNNLERNENINISGYKKLYLEGPEDVMQLKQNCAESDKTLFKTAPDTVDEADLLSGLSVLEMDSKLDDVCLDFDEEIEDDALSLATSCFNSSDDERCPDLNKTSLETASNKINEDNDSKTISSMENSEKLDDIIRDIKVEPTPPIDASSDILKKFKIPKISMTTATAKHGNPAATVVTAAPLPMVILPPNVFNRQLIKTVPDTIKPPNFEKITRTVQNVCAVTPLTLQNLNGPATFSQNSFVTVPPLIRDMLQLAPSIIKDDEQKLKSFNTKQVPFSRGEIAGNGGDGTNYGPPTIVVAKTFGVTCLPFLVRRCFTLTSCKFSHSFLDPESVRNVLNTLSEVDLNIAYKFAYKHELVFRQYIREFCRVYFERNNRMKLLHMVRDCERYKGGEEILITIFHNLLYCGLNKVNACRQILSYSRDRSRSTIDALLNIIFEADWTMFCDYIEKFSDIPSYHFRLNVLHQMASTILRANDQRMTSLFFKCLVNLDPNDVGLVQTSPILMQLLELIKNGQVCR